MNVDAALDVGGGRDGVGAVVRNDRVFLSFLQVCALLVRLMLRLWKQLLSIKRHWSTRWSFELHFYLMGSVAP
ncbi:hypothetical protein LWI28_012410 [Acer negundo]|uniref:Uncharacterized protein n=1 Tax=Acer negundo TaxID=4023 RepID=A0AAD5J4E6_ACENE|nr:hypothetical protein LWI28_012410 [Acer negundo]